jgi:hypothetical protein
MSKLTALDLERTSSAPSDLPPDILSLAQQLSQIHGRIRVAQENSGLHFYLASPACLEEDGLVELDKMHLAINVDKWARGQDNCAYCMKTSTPYRVLDLLSMPRLEKRGYTDVQRSISAPALNEGFLEDDGRGHMVPKSPGKVIPAHELEPDHPARVYLENRGYRLRDLCLQFRLSYCLEERSDVYYRRLAGLGKATPQGRLIFFIDVNGVAAGWQGRIPEATTTEEDGVYKWFLHPYNLTWLKMMKQDEQGKFRALPGYDEPAKYIIGAGARRNAILMGYDEAIRWNTRFRRSGEPRVCVLTEGALDAGRVGPPGVAMLGKFLGADQAALLAARFDHVIYVAQNDQAGQDAKKKVAAALSKHIGVRLDCLDVPAAFKDMGEMTRPAARALVQTAVGRVWRTEEGYL